MPDLLSQPPAGLRAAQVVIIGEIHDNPTHHQTQAALVAKLAPKALVFEMLTPAQAEASRGVDRSDAVAMEAAAKAAAKAAARKTGNGPWRG